MSYKVNCSKILNENMIVRVFLFFLFLLILFKYSDNKIIHKYLLVILITALFISDKSDTIFPNFIAPLFTNEKPKYNNCLYTNFYIIKDKIADLASYVLVFLIFFKNDYLLLAFILYRAVGIVLYLITNNTNWFILFFDFIKEYLLYNYLFKTNKYIFIFIILKIIYEYFNYSIFNSRYHDNKVDILEKGIILV
jgi:hypothetical protein